MAFRAPEGTRDILPDEAALWRRLEDAARATFDRFGYEEVRSPILEYTALFHKSSGETTDIVEKEMYTFGGADGREDSLSLRPELTPGVVRALVEKEMLAKKPFWKLWYFGPAFRKERPQKGRYRQFTQLGVEAVGSSDPLVDAETMVLFGAILGAVGVTSWELRINSMGCGACRGAYREALRAAVQPELAKYCENCRRRFERNVFRILDCKVETCSALAAGLPSALQHACDACKAHMKAVERALGDAEIPYRVDPRIVRGLDYYTRTVYEFSSASLGAQNALCGGGRYDTLVRDMGGPDVGSVGFAAGAERILLAMSGEAAARSLDFFGVAVTEELRGDVFRAATALRRAGLTGDMDFEGRSMKAQMRSANRSGARFAVIIGPEEAEKKLVKVKNMGDSSERQLALGDAAAFLKARRL
jgi:histidyl-tRNA synthetase